MEGRYSQPLHWQLCESGPAAQRGQLPQHCAGCRLYLPEPRFLLWQRALCRCTNYSYDAIQHSLFGNLLFLDQSDENNRYTLGLSDTFDYYTEKLSGGKFNTPLNTFGAFGEYTFHYDTKLSVIAGLRADLYNPGGMKVSPRLTLKYAPNEKWVLRANGGRGIRYSTPLIDNIGVFSTGKTFTGIFDQHPLEESWTFGGNISWYPFGGSSTYLSLDYFHTQFAEQMLVENSANAISFYTLSSLGKEGESYTDNIQLDFYTEPFEGFSLTLTGRFTNPKQSLVGQNSSVKPMTSLYKGVLNMQYATHLNKWIFSN